MPAKSKAQQKFMGAVYALKKGDVKPSDVTPAVKKVAKDMKKSDAKDFASTKHKGLPKKVKQEILNKLKEYASKMGTNTLGGDDYTTSRKGGLRDFDGYDNVDYNKDMPMDEATKGDIMRAVKGKPNPYTLVVIKRGKVIYQKDIKNPQDAPAIYSVIKKHMDKGEKIHIEDRTGKILFKESVSPKQLKALNLGLKKINRKFKGASLDGKTIDIELHPGHNRDSEIYQIYDLLKKLKLDKNKTSIFNEGMFSTIDQIRQDSKDVRDFVKKVFADRDFKDMKNDKEFLKYLKSIYEGVEEAKLPNNWMSGRTSDYHTKLRGKKRDYDDTNFDKKDSGQPDLEEYGQRLDLSYLEDEDAKLVGTPPSKDAIDRDIDESTLNELGIFPIQNYVKGIIPGDFINTTTPQNKERLRSTLRDLKNTLNKFWKQHKIPYRVR